MTDNCENQLDRETAERRAVAILRLTYQLSPKWRREHARSGTRGHDLQPGNTIPSPNSDEA